MRRIYRAFLACTAVVALGLLPACTDDLAGVQEAPATQPYSKMRHAHLFAGSEGPGKLVEHYDLSSSTEFILAASSTVLDMNKLVEHYEAEAGVTVKRTFRSVYRGFAMHVDPDHVERILSKVQGDPNIAWIEPDPKVSLPKPAKTDIKFGRGQYVPWGADVIDADVSGLLTKKGTEMLAAVDLFILDTGVSADDVWATEHLNFSPASSGANDVVGHGSHVAGTAAAKNNSEGILGVAPNVRVRNLKVLDDNGKAEFSTVIAAIDHITGLKISNPAQPMVVNISFGGNVGTTEYTSLDDAIAASIRAGVVYVIAAGNEGIDASTVTPAHVADAITVGAYNADKTFASYSNYGSVVDLLAPGTKVISLPSKHSGTGFAELIDLSGTSMAAPHVAGAAALYLALNPLATPAEVAGALALKSKSWVTGVPASTTTRSVYVGSML